MNQVEKRRMMGRLVSVSHELWRDFIDKKPLRIVWKSRPRVTAGTIVGFRVVYNGEWLMGGGYGDDYSAGELRNRKAVHHILVAIHPDRIPIRVPYDGLTLIPKGKL